MNLEALQAMCESKNRYPTKKAARTAINAALRRRRKRPEHLREYQCPVCNGYHLTHKS
ncbi:MAG TPA: hypothetical protein VIM61_00660 [Chthoniobacterales bacterium]